jgi:hypothetical protein
MHSFSPASTLCKRYFFLFKKLSSDHIESLHGLEVQSCFENQWFIWSGVLLIWINSCCLSKASLKSLYRGPAIHGKFLFVIHSKSLFANLMLPSEESIVCKLNVSFFDCVTDLLHFLQLIIVFNRCLVLHCLSQRLIPT